MTPSAGAVAANHVAYTGGSAAPGMHVARAEDALTGDRFEIRGRVLVNAAGPWSDAVGALAGRGTIRDRRPVRGFHQSVRFLTPETTMRRTP